MKIYLDHCAYNRPFDDQNNIKNQLETSAKLHIQDMIKQGKYDLIWSYMSDFENYYNPNIENKKSIQLWEKISKYKCKSSENVLILGTKISKKGIRANDALHIACAIESQCEYFITTDASLTNKKIEGIKIINPIDFVRKMEEKMRTETVLKVEVMDLLLKTFGVLETERFITSIKNNNFDYTEWRKNLWKDKSISEIHNMVAEFEKEKDIKVS